MKVKGLLRVHRRIPIEVLDHKIWHGTTFVPHATYLASLMTLAFCLAML